MEGSGEALRVGFCDSAAAKYACEHWHYSGSTPVGAVVRFGVWEDDVFIGAVLYSKGAGMATMRAHRYGLERTDACELARVALNRHRAPVTQIVSKTVKQLQVVNPGLRLVISYADPAQGHLGTIYQAGNWIYVGRSAKVKEYWIGGKWTHNRTLRAIGITAMRNGRHPRYLEWLHQLRTRDRPGKFCYLMPLDKPTRRILLPYGEPYPAYADLAEQVSEARRHPSGVEG